MSQNSSSRLKINGFSEDEIEIIHNLDEVYTNHLKANSKLSDKELENLGYSKDQIDLLRNYEGKEEETIKLAATLTLRLSAPYVRHNSFTNRTNAQLGVNWTWAGVPLIKRTDIIGVSWNDWHVTSSSGSLTYIPITGSPGYLYESATILANNGPASFGRGIRIPMTQQDNYWWARSGSATFDLNGAHTGRKDLTAYAEYGHTTINITPGFSIPGYGAINFNVAMDVAGVGRVTGRVSN
ncbi:hypothetical protein [Ornithinibacillus halophilus]|uniref:Uncharacterized protein n=1 Tax=Ornithinibacillus halophilus TaxID=930117 RepID=A0A1M5F2Y0_9BACI|nr:hypothetical protein [Ornithinibacillus halophilus]SHF85521.1 hypothetical protein SAMN05216225_100718 [Ornithinibacillus halophilus]